MKHPTPHIPDSLPPESKISDCRQLISLLVLVCYVSLGITGTPGAFQIFGTTRSQASVERSKPIPTHTTRVYWTQHKHLVVSAKSSTVSSALIAAPELPNPFFRAVAIVCDRITLDVKMAGTSHSSRAPPLS